MHDLVLVFADAEHHACLGHPDALLLGVCKDGQTLSECRAAVADKWREGFDGLDVVRVDVQS